MYFKAIILKPDLVIWSKINPACPFSTASGLIMVKVLLVDICYCFLNSGAKVNEFGKKNE
jgi:hypothetical protein